MIFSPKPKISYQYFSSFFPSPSKLRHILKKDESHSWFISQVIHCKMVGYFNAYKTLRQNTYGESTCQSVRNTAEIFKAVVLSNFFINLKELQFEKLFFSSIWNLETVCEHIDSQWQVFSLGKSECLTKSIQMIFSPKTQNIFWIFFTISRVYIRIWTFWNKRWAS